MLLQLAELRPMGIRQISDKNKEDVQVDEITQIWSHSS